MMKRLLYGIAERAPNSFDYLDLEMSKEEVAKSDLRGLFLIGAVLALLLCIRIAHDQELLAPALFKMLARELGLAVLLESDLLLKTCRFVISLLILHRRRKARRRAYRNNRRLLLPLSREGSQEGLLRPCLRSA